MKEFEERVERRQTDEERKVEEFLEGFKSMAEYLTSESVEKELREMQRRGEEVVEEFDLLRRDIFKTQKQMETSLESKFTEFKAYLT